MFAQENFTDADVQRILEEYRTKEANKVVVKTFYQELFGDKNLEAIDKYIDNTTYIQHNPSVADGAEALRKGASMWFPPGSPKTTIDIKHIGADGDLVFLHVRAVHGERVDSVIDIFRLRNGKIIEHWDTIQEAKTEGAKNDHPFF